MTTEEIKDIDGVRRSMIEFYSGEPKYVHHFLKVHAFAKMIAEAEGLDERTQYILEIASLTHDIGIKAALENYGSSAGKYQEFEGPTYAGEMLERLGLDDDVIDRVCFLISKHHTVADVVGMDWRILLEADFLVNAFEEGYSEKQIQAYRENVFETETGKSLLDVIYKKGG